MHQESNHLDNISNENPPDDHMLIELGARDIIVQSNATGTHLPDLNEDCLLEIFSNNSLTLMDLCSLAETCTRFKQTTQRVFPNEFGIERCRDHWKHWISKLGYEFESKNYRGDYNSQDVERISKNFGSLLSRLKINGDVAIVSAVAAHCGDATLKRLEICALKSIEGIRLQLNSICQRMLHLSVRHCRLVIAPADMNCDSLIELEIGRSVGCATFLTHTFPSLQRFTWRYSEMYEGNGSFIWLVNFFERHTRLKTINVSGAQIYQSNFLSVISSSCKELEQLILRDLIYMHRDNSIDSRNLESLAKLKLLDIDFEFANHCNIALLRSLQSLETLKISGEFEASSQLFDVLSQLQSLREVHLPIRYIHLILWKTFARLRKLSLCWI